MKKINWVLMLGLALTANLGLAAGDAENGAQFVALCATCHGEGGNNATGAFPNLAGQSASYLLKQMQDQKEGVRSIPQMTGMLAGFNDDQLKDIAAYYAEQAPQITGSKEIEDETYNLSAEEFLALGERIFRGGNIKTGVAACTGCHSPSGSGNDPAKYPRVAGQHYDYLVAQLKNFQGNLRTNDGEGKLMRAVAEPMTDLEIRAVANFLAGLN